MSQRPRRDSLPTQLTSFVGRVREVAEVAARLGEHRLVTLTGAGGVGKTRLALEVGARVLAGFPDGVWAVELAPLADPAHVPRAVATRLGIEPRRGEPPPALLEEQLADRELLLFLDNCEHLTGACADLAGALLRACPGVRILATSRERLGVPGEAVYVVPSLESPGPRDPPRPEELARFAAVHLFVERARLVRADFALSEVNARLVADICRRLDGIPLAIELAAAWVRVLPVEEIAARLAAGPFRLLTGGRGAPPRQQTMVATLDWSYELLADQERALLRALSVFVGGFELEAAEAVGGGDAVLDELTGLVDKSLVVMHPRYRLLEPIRQYAAEKLVASGEAGAVRDRHRDFYLGLAEEAASGILGPDQVPWVERLETEHDNLRAALAWSQADPDGAEKEERMAGALGRFWRDRGYYREGFAWLMHAAERRPGMGSLGRGRSLNWAAVNAQHGDFAHEQQAPLLEESVAVLRQVDAPSDLSLALRHLWINLYLSNRHLGTSVVDASLLEEALAVARGVPDQREIGQGLLNLSQVALNRGDLGEARRLADEALATVRGLDPSSVLNVLVGLGRVTLAQGEHARAETVFREMLDRSHEAGDRVWMADAWLGLAGSLRARGDVAGARDCFREVVAELRASPAGQPLRRVLLGLAMLEAGSGRDRRAARLLGAFAAGGGNVAGSHSAGWPVEGFELGPDLATIRGRLDHESFAGAIEEGRKLTVEQALDEALADAPRSARSDPLTAREREVARLIAEGKSNREIAAALVIAEPTVERHVANIMNKLGVHVRAQIAVWVTKNLAALARK